MSDVRDRHEEEKEVRQAGFCEAAERIYEAGYADGVAAVAADSEWKREPQRLPRLVRTTPTPIMVWRFRDAPEVLRRLSTSGGDEGWLALLPDDNVPLWCDGGGSFGICNTEIHRLADGRVVAIGCHT